jgi:hypothetical protein
MILNEILSKRSETYLKEKNDNLIETINFLVDESEKYHLQLEILLAEIETTPIEDDFFYKNVKKDDFKKRGLILEEKIKAIEKKWAELILILNQRFNEKN